MEVGLLSKFDVLGLFKTVPLQNQQAKENTDYQTVRRRKYDNASDFKISMLEKLKSSSVSRWGPSRPPRFVYRIESPVNWMASAKSYFPRGATEIACCDIDRLDAFVARNYFYTKYESAVDEMDTFVGRTLRSLADLSESFSAKLSIVQPASLENGPALRSPYESSETVAEIEDNKDYLLLIIDTSSFVSDGSLCWNTKNAYPCITRPINKNSDVCLEFRLRFDLGYRHMSVCLPSEELILKQTKAFVNSLCLMHSIPSENQPPY